MRQRAPTCLQEGVNASRWLISIKKEINLKNMNNKNIKSILIGNMLSFSFIFQFHFLLNTVLGLLGYSSSYYLYHHLILAFFTFYFSFFFFKKAVLISCFLSHFFNVLIFQPTYLQGSDPPTGLEFYATCFWRILANV